MVHEPEKHVGKQPKHSGNAPLQSSLISTNLRLASQTTRIGTTVCYKGPNSIGANYTSILNERQKSFRSGLCECRVCVSFCIDF